MFEFDDIVSKVLYVWNIVLPYLGVLLSYLAGIFSLFLIWIAKRFYDAKLRNPAKMYFLIPDTRLKLDYVKQDTEEHLVKEIVLPSYRESQVLIWFKPKVNYYENEHYFGCEGDLTKKPKVIKYSNPFLLKHNLQITYYQDWHQYYHLQTGKNRIKDEVYVGGFIVRTFAKGEYKAKVLVHTPTKLGRTKLKISVRDEPSTEVLCYVYKEEKREVKEPLKKKEIKKLFRKKHKKHNIKFGTY